MLEHKSLAVTVYEKQSKINLVKLLGQTLTDLFGSHFLALQLTKRDVSAQYRQSYFGILWLFITPLASAAIWVFLNSSGTITITDTGIPYPVYAFSGTLIWSILLESINAPMTSTNAARGIISKINFPKEALVLSGIYKLLFNSSFKVLLLVVFIFAFGVGFHWSLLLLPLFIVMAVVFGTSLGLLITPIGLLYSDVSRLITMGLSLLMYVTPVVYGIPKTGVMKMVMTYNPFTAFILTIRDVAVGNSPEYLNYFLGFTGLGLVLFFIGLVIYRVSIPVIVERLSA
jgi:lipopolysaccharide transport system permease protein